MRLRGAKWSYGRYCIEIPIAVTPCGGHGYQDVEGCSEVQSDPRKVLHRQSSTEIPRDGLLRCQRCTMVNQGMYCFNIRNSMRLSFRILYQDVLALAMNKGYPMVFKRMQGN